MPAYLRPNTQPLNIFPLSPARHTYSTQSSLNPVRTNIFRMPSINVSLKDGADASQLDSAKKQVTEQGGKITTEFKLIKGFTAEFPEDKVHTLSSNEHINVENDGEVRTQ
ncbi:hypothetical protein AUEXF2481DRAFT_5379 [Aureobasidium subglaciale EXF-2481]|uniref:Uncharacterized protein n=1 Tax=Aureobasidium subglaciale (strain EXF-2481) TaxID=1043005 RepID=A0A074YBJ7_AURSE|nr:uncharacterized protein AUEXF2481DRAFT_5379 [Aureobasidium subglaciale EXF-2481]KEQ95138.1 hypothetical protein AUEXF2481DRAFT_5379 [Aureobasidium subglaciale EXF-2481]